ncbi:hypothetical protein BS78_01G432100 [Paspalum vaginatum]|nr:hypothetical protein BS78_01G432100 [Paspalum vaginatum]
MPTLYYCSLIDILKLNIIRACMQFRPTSSPDHRVFGSRVSRSPANVGAGRGRAGQPPSPSPRSHQGSPIWSARRGHPACAPLRAPRSHPAPTCSAPSSPLSVGAAGGRGWPPNGARLPETPVAPSITVPSQHVLTGRPQHHHAPRRSLSPWICSVAKAAVRGMEPPAEAPLPPARRRPRLPLPPVSRPLNLSLLSARHPPRLSLPPEHPLAGRPRRPGAPWSGAPARPRPRTVTRRPSSPLPTGGGSGGGWISW